MRSRLDRATDARDDAYEYASTWGWAWAPSKARALGRRYDKLDAKVVRLGGESKPWPRSDER